MFGLFKKKTEIEKMHDQYKVMMKEYHDLSHYDRMASSRKMAEAEALMDKIEALQKSN